METGRLCQARTRRNRAKPKSLLLTGTHLLPRCQGEHPNPRGTEGKSSAWVLAEGSGTCQGGDFEKGFQTGGSARRNPSRAHTSLARGWQVFPALTVTGTVAHGQPPACHCHTWLGTQVGSSDLVL